MQLNFVYQNSLASWIEDVGSDDESEVDIDDTNDDATQVTSDDMSGSGTDEEDQAPKRPRNPIVVFKHPKTHLCSTITR
jgi:hypothetical protein